MRTLLIEDEKAALRNLKAAMKEVDTDFEIVGETDSVTGTIEWFKSHPMPELVFMDIHLADGSAFNIFSQTDITCPIIFTTAYDEYALQAFRVNSIAYLLKPISSDDLQRAINKLKMLERHNPRENVNGLQQIIRTLCREETFKTHFLIPVKGDKFIPINVEDIMYFYIEDGTVKSRDQNNRDSTFSSDAGRDCHNAASAKILPRQPPVHHITQSSCKHQPLVRRTVKRAT